MRKCESAEVRNGLSQPTEAESRMALPLPVRKTVMRTENNVLLLQHLDCSCAMVTQDQMQAIAKREEWLQVELLGKSKKSITATDTRASPSGFLVVRTHSIVVRTAPKESNAGDHWYRRPIGCLIEMNQSVTQHRRYGPKANEKRQVVTQQKRNEPTVRTKSEQRKVNEEDWRSSLYGIY